MKPNRHRHVLATIAATLLASAAFTSAAVYNQNFDGFADGTTDLGDGSQMNGASASVQGEALELTIDGQGLGFASFNIPALAGSSLGFTVTYDLTIIDSVGANPPADGFSFNYGNFVIGQLGAAEEGMQVAHASENLSFEIDTWMNFDTEQGVNISGNAGGADVGQLAFNNGPILDDGTTVSGTVTMSWNPGTGASFTTTGLLTNANFFDIPTTFTPDDTHIFGFSGRVGGANQTVLIDNLVITTETPGDTDGDGLSDAYETANGLDPSDDGTVGESSPGAKDGPNGALGDLDGDGISNIDERDNGTHPNNDDTDGDGLLDGVEDGGGTFVSDTETGTDPLNDDSDADGLLDGVEDNGGTFVDANMTGTDPNNGDTDGDTVGDGAEVAAGTDPTVFQTPPSGEFWDFEGFADGTTDLGDGTVIFGTSASIQNGQLELTIDGIGAGFSSFSVPPIAGSSGGWTATFDVTIIDGPAANEPADGFSFNYGSAPLGTRGNAEEGIPTGNAPENLSFEVDTWMNNDAEQGVNISGNAGGVDVGQLAFTNGPILLDGTTVSASVTISYDPSLGATFITSGPLPGVAGSAFQTNANFIDVDTGAFAAHEDHTFIITARVGGANETVLIDNLRISVNTDDTDGDGLLDTWEDANLPAGARFDDGSVNPDFGAAGDPDADGLTNVEERDRGTDPQSNDTDGDGLLDGVEDGGGVYVSASQTGTNPRDPDSDDDGLADGVEIPTETFIDANQPGTDPNNADTDGDGFSDQTDILLGLDPTVANPPLPAPTTTYKSNFGAYADGTTDLNDGTTIAGAAARIQGGQLMLTEDLLGLGFSSFTVPPLQGSSNGWTATFDLTITDSVGANAPADGLSFNYGDAAEGELGSAEEGMAAIGSVTENLSFEIDTWMNFDAEQGVNIAEKVGGIDTSLSFTNGPILDDGTSVGGAVTISWNPVDGASFTTTGLLTNADFSNVATSFVPDDSHTFIFSARVGGANQTVLIDNLCVSTLSIDRHNFAVSSADDGANIDFSWDSNGSELYSIVSTDDPVANPDPNTWPVVAGLENIAATPPLNLASMPKPAEALRLFKLIAAPVPPLFSEDFESGLNGWTTGVDDAFGNTMWELGSPNGTSGPITGADGSLNAFSTNLGDYGVDSDIFLRSPDIDLTGATAACLVFEQFRDADGFSDIGTVRILKASDLSELQVIDPDLFALDVGFESFSADFDAAVLGETIIIEFRYLSDSSVDPFSGWTIDNVEVILK